MKAEVTAKELKSGLKTMTALQTYGKERATDSFTQGCLMTVSEDVDDELVLEATSSGAYLRRVIPAKTVRPGKVGVDAARILSQNLSSGNVLLDCTGNQISMKFRNTAKANLTANQDIEASIADNRPNDDVAHLATLPFELLKDAVQSVTYPPGAADAETYGIPIAFEAYTLFYNKDHVDKYLDGLVLARPV